MAKKIVLCFDGTWQDPRKQTNVIKIYKSILGEDKSSIPVGKPVQSLGVPTIKWYDKGVGTKWGNKIRGGFLGRGLAKNILQDAYRYLMPTTTESGDEVLSLRVQPWSVYGQKPSRA